jgi:transcriptional regulator with PAS, ATPase and Fis domain
MIYTGKIIRADEALRIGLVNSVHEPEELMPAAIAMAQKMVACAPTAICLAKLSINENYDLNAPEALELESKLFGSIKGAFTDSRDSRGLFEAAEGGTLFLDEVAELDLDMQGQLLRVLQDDDFLKVGESVPRKIQNVRIIAATNKDIVRLVNEGRFREDLYYRLNVIQIRMKSLAERPEDIPEIAKTIWYRETGKSLSREQCNALIQYDFPGNARELENMLIYARVMKVTDFGELVEHWKRENAGLRRDASHEPASDDESLDVAVARHIRMVADRHKDRPVKEIARRLGCSENTVRKWLKVSESGVSAQEKATVGGL